MRHLLFSKQSVLDSCISLPILLRAIPSNSISNKVALITGATGFIGGFLLKELLKKESFELIICIVRADSQESGFERVKTNLLSKGTPEALINPDIISIEVGDILEPNFGLNEAVYPELCQKIDHLFHFAATMNWVTPFNSDTLANVTALKTAISFCVTNRLKKLHYASSMGMWTLLNHAEGPIMETAIHAQGYELPGGYFQSKWVGESILKLALQEGIPVNIYRIGDVKGDAENGLGDPQNFGNLVMQYFMQRGVAIDSDVPEFNFIPVDFLAKAIAHISTTDTGKTFQFSNPDLISFKDIYYSIFFTGRAIRLVDYREWSEIINAETSPFGKILNPIFKSFTPDPSLAPTSFYKIGMEMFQKKHDTTNTESALKGDGYYMPWYVIGRCARKIPGTFG